MDLTGAWWQPVKRRWGVGVALLFAISCGKDGNRSNARDDSGSGSAHVDAAILDVSASHTEALISSTGGKLSLAGAILLVPAGALQSPQLISISVRPGTNDPADRDMVGEVYDFQPDGLAFAVPATLTIAHVDGDFGLTRDDLLIASKSGTDQWLGLDTWPSDDGLNAFIDHFSRKGRGKIINIPPPCGQKCKPCDLCQASTRTCRPRLAALCDHPWVFGGKCNQECVCPTPHRDCGTEQDFDKETCDCKFDSFTGWSRTSNNQISDAEVTWRWDGKTYTSPGVRKYRPSGTVTYYNRPYIKMPCTDVSIPSDGPLWGMSLDTRKRPYVFHGFAGAACDVTFTNHDDPTKDHVFSWWTAFPEGIAPPTATVSEQGRVIAGDNHSDVGGSFRFVRDEPPLR